MQQQSLQNQIILAAREPARIPPEGINPLTIGPQDGDTASLPTAIQEWRRIQNEIAEHKQTIRERNRRAKALEEFIMSIMKRYNIGALDLKSSNGRVLYKRSKRTAGLNPKTLKDLAAEFLHNPAQADELVKFINANRETKMSEKLSYEQFTD